MMIIIVGSMYSITCKGRVVLMTLMTFTHLTIIKPSQGFSQNTILMLTHACTCTCTHTDTDRQTDTYIHTQTHTHTHTHARTHTHAHTIKALLSTHTLGRKRVWQTSYGKVVSDICQTKHTLTLGAVPAVGYKLLLRPRPHFGTS